MRFLVKPVRCALFLVFGLGLGGCLPSERSQLDEEKDSHYLAGKNRLNALDYQGALECFEKALEANPRSSAGHLEAGLLYEKYPPDYAAAIYHLDRFLKLRPNSDYAKLVEQRIVACKQELARTVTLGPVTQALQREYERLAEQNKRLQEENERWRVYATHLQTLTNPPSQTSRTERPASVTRSIPAPTVTEAPAPPSKAEESHPIPASMTVRTHTVKSGETPSVIARRYGVKVTTLMAANPRLDPRRLQVGQALTVPAQ
jgi:LysM repeat protein